MNNKQLNEIINRIKKGTGLKVNAIAAKAGVNRSYLSTTINDEEIKPVDESFIGKLAIAFPGYFNQHNPTDNRIDEILASLDEIRGFAISILTGQSAGNEVMMGALDRIEKNPEGSLSEAADKLALRLAKRMNMIQKGKKAGERT